MTVIYLLFAIVLNALAHIFIKISAQKGLALGTWNVFKIISQNYLALIGPTSAFISLLFYFLALKKMPLSTAYPLIVATSFLLINFYAFYFLNEKIGWLHLLGFALIVSGIICTYIAFE